jgi:tRNA pseudouridine55 synthase
VHGILLLDKPEGLSSNEALQRAKQLYRARKAGHTGSLDPLADGLLPICFGEATKVSSFLLDSPKLYRFTCRLGVRTSTGDREGEIVAAGDVEPMSDQALERLLDRFRGEIEQIPPMHSAIHHGGKRLYELARQGVTVAREPRRVAIHELEVLRYEGEELELRVFCSKGTYIRTLAEDIGAAMGCGAHVSRLRRLGVDPYLEPRMHRLDALESLAGEGTAALDELLLPIESALERWPPVHLSDDLSYYLRQGQPVLVPRAPTQGLVRLLHEDEGFIGMGEVLDDGRIAPRRLMHARATGASKSL